MSLSAWIVCNAARSGLSLRVPAELLLPNTVPLT